MSLTTYTVLLGT